MAIVAKIQSLCAEKKTTLPKLEKELGFSNGSVYKWDVNSPSIDKVARVALYFGVSVDSLISKSE